MIRKGPTILSILFIAVTLQRVANFFEHQVNSSWTIAYLVSSAVAGGVFVSSALTVGVPGNKAKSLKFRRGFAAFVLLVFVLFDGIFNLADVIATAKPDTNPLFVYAFGIFPTVAVVLLGILQALVDVAPYKKTETPQLISDIRQFFGLRVENKKKTVAKPKTKPAETKNETGQKPVSQPITNLSETQKAIVEAVNRNPHISHAEIARALPVSPQAVGKARRKLEDAGVISSNGHGKDRILP